MANKHVQNGKKTNKWQIKWQIDTKMPITGQNWPPNIENEYKVSLIKNEFKCKHIQEQIPLFD